jgi:hypothetical protein
MPIQVIEAPLESIPAPSYRSNFTVVDDVELVPIPHHECPVPYSQLTVHASDWSLLATTPLRHDDSDPPNVAYVRFSSIWDRIRLAVRIAIARSSCNHTVTDFPLDVENLPSTIALRADLARAEATIQRLNQAVASASSAQQAFDRLHRPGIQFSATGIRGFRLNNGNFEYLNDRNSWSLYTPVTAI